MGPSARFWDSPNVARPQDVAGKKLLHARLHVPMFGVVALKACHGHPRIDEAVGALPGQGHVPEVKDKFSDRSEHSGKSHYSGISWYSDMFECSKHLELSKKIRLLNKSNIWVRNPH